MIFMQTRALFIDAYRELNAKKLFWITMALNLMAVVIFASLGINAKGSYAIQEGASISELYHEAAGT